MSTIETGFIVEQPFSLTGYSGPNIESDPIEAQFIQGKVHFDKGSACFIFTNKESSLYYPITLESTEVLLRQIPPNRLILEAQESIEKQFRDLGVPDSLIAVLSKKFEESLLPS